MCNLFEGEALFEKQCKMLLSIVHHGFFSTRTTAEKLTGNGSLMMTGGPTQEKRISQTVFSGVSIDARQKYLLSAWAKADSVPLHDNTTFALFARATYYDVVTHASAVVEYRADYNAASSGWQTAERRQSMNFCFRMTKS